VDQDQRQSGSVSISDEAGEAYPPPLGAPFKSYPNRAIRIVLGVMTLIPFGVAVAVFGSIFIAASTASDAPPWFLGDPDTSFNVFLSVCMGIGAFSVSLLAYFLVFIFRSPRVRNEHKALWAIVLFMSNGLGFPVFWYVYFWRDAEQLARSPA